MAWTRILGSNISNSTKALLSNLYFYSSTGIFGLPVGTTAQRPGEAVNEPEPELGTLRFNLTKDSAEIYNTQTGVADWNGVGSETGIDGGDAIIRTNGTTITKDITIGPIANGDQKYTYGFLVGDVTIDNGITVDIEQGAGLLIYTEPESFIFEEPTIIQDNLITWLDAANNASYPGSGTTWTDLVSGNGYTINGNPQYLVDTGGVFRFDGVDDNVTLTPGAIPVGNEVTFGVWIYGTTMNKSSSIIEARNSGNLRTLNVHLTWSNSTVYFDAGGTTSTTGYDRLQKTALSTEYLGWHYWVFIKNATTGVMQIYLDGGLWIESTGNTLPLGYTTNARIGSYYNDTTYHQGYVSNLHIYDRALSDAEVNLNYLTLRDRFVGSTFP